MRNRLRRSAIRAAMATPWFVRFASRGRSQGVDAALDRQVAAALEYQRVARLPALESMEPPDARAFALRNLGASELVAEPMDEVIDTVLGPGPIEPRFSTDPVRVPARIYIPHRPSGNWMVWYHGGGGVIGSIMGSEPVARYIAAHTGCTVASIGYRLGPEDPHPAAIEDACVAYRELIARVPTDRRVAVGGDSFGGFLAAHVDRYAHEAKLRVPDVQVLVYPILDLTLTSPSIDRYAEGYLLTKSMMTWFREHYLGGGDRQGPSPWFWADVRNSAPAIIHTAGFDPLVDEGDAWANRLREAGVTVRHQRYESLVHGFLALGGVVRAARGAADDLCREIVEMLGE